MIRHPIEEVSRAGVRALKAVVRRCFPVVGGEPSERLKEVRGSNRRREAKRSEEKRREAKRSEEKRREAKP